MLRWCCVGCGGWWFAFVCWLAVFAGLVLGSVAFRFGCLVGLGCFWFLVCPVCFRLFGEALIMGTAPPILNLGGYLFHLKLGGRLPFGFVSVRWLVCVFFGFCLCVFCSFVCFSAFVFCLWLFVFVLFF